MISWCLTFAVFLASAEHGDRHSWPDDSTDRPRGGQGTESCLPEGSETDARRQAEEVRGR